MSFPLASGPHFDTPGYGSPHCTALHCIPHSFSLRGKPFPLFPLPLWALPCIQTEVLALLGMGYRETGEVREREPGVWARTLGLSSSFSKEGIGNIKGGGWGVWGNWLEGR